jgi:hypothetical protein
MYTLKTDGATDTGDTKVTKTDGTEQNRSSGTDSTKLAILNNLSDLNNVATAKTNLSLVKADVGLGNVDNTSDSTKNSASVTLTNKTISGSSNTLSNIAQSSVTNLTTDLSAKEATANKDASGGYAGLTLLKINFKNVLNTFTSFFTNSNTASRTYTFQDSDDTIVGRATTDTLTNKTINALSTNALTITGSGSNPQLTLDTASGITGIKINSNTASSYSTFWLSTSGASGVAYLFGSSYVTSGRFIQGSYLFDNNSTGGITFNCQNSGSNAVIRFMTNSANERMRIDKDGNVGIGQTTVTARLHLPAGATGASSAPLKLASGSLNTTAEAGAVEFLTDQIYFTQTQNALRKEIVLREATRVSTQFDKTNATLANVTGLTATLGAGKTYKFKAVLFVDCDVVGGQKYAIAGTATATSIIYQINSYDNSTNVNTINSRQTALAGSASQAGTTVAYTEITGTITCNATGTLTVQFAQNTASGTSSVLVGSSFTVENIL